MQCPSCNKFAPKNTDEEPEGELDIDEQGMVTGEIRIVNTSECCGEELEETNFNVEIDLTDDVRKHLEKNHKPWLDARAEREQAKKKLKPLDPETLDVFDRCGKCGTYWQAHHYKVRGNRVNVMNHKMAAQKDAHKAECAYGNGTFVLKPKKSVTSGEPSLSVEADITRTDESPSVDRNGKTIKNARYRKRFYGIAVQATVTCDDCKTEIASGNFADHVQASGMDSLV